MSIPIIHDGEAPGVARERCALCRTPTNWWHKGKDVACCPDCAAVKKVRDLPSKKEWFEKELALCQTPASRMQAIFESIKHPKETAK